MLKIEHVEKIDKTIEKLVDDEYEKQAAQENAHDKRMKTDFSNFHTLALNSKSENDPSVCFCSLKSLQIN